MYEYNNTENNKSGQGILQGSSSACPIFILNSNVSLSAYRKHATGASFKHPISGRIVTDYAVQFVDDTSQFVNENVLSHNSLGDPETNICHAMMQAASSNAQMWADYLWTSGGKLQLSKCFDFAFKPYINYKTNQVSYIKFTTDAETYTIKPH
jgi:hypothetical protein